MSDGFDKISAATGLPVGVSAELRKFFERSLEPAFIRQHNERLLRAWEKSNPDHPQCVYALFDVVVTGKHIEGPFKPFASFDTKRPDVLHHQYFFQAEKELEYWALKYLGCKVSVSFYVRHYVGTERWVFIERKTISLDAR